jgi:hypothetical protein
LVAFVATAVLFINDLEKMIADDDARREEVTQLVAQKRKALEDLHHIDLPWNNADWRKK